MSTASIDRHLSTVRAKLARRGRSHSKPGTLADVPDPGARLGRPVRRYARVRRNRPGRPLRGNSSGEFCFTLTVTDRARGRTINQSVKNKAAIWVFQAIGQSDTTRPPPRFNAEARLDVSEACRSTVHHTMDEHSGQGTLPSHRNTHCPPRTPLGKAAAPVKLPLNRGFTQACIRRFI
jgi:hypothetical protein